MSKRDADAPAFPTNLAITPSGDVYPGFYGVTFRDYFAAQALIGLLAYPGGEGLGSWHSNSNPAGTVAKAFEYADAMLAARAITEPASTQP